MKRIYIKYLIGFISFALLGIVVVQLLWINNTISENEQQFHARAYAMLHRVVQKTEQNEVALMYRLKPRITHYSSSKPSKSSDSLMRALRKQTLNQMRAVSAHSPFARDIQQFINQMDSLQESFDSQFSDKNEQLQTMNQWLSFEAEVKQLTLEDRLKLSRVDQILMQEKSNFNISTPIEYAVVEPTSGKAVISSEGFLRKNEKTYKVELFPNDIMSPSPFLLVQFPQKNKFLLHSIQWLLLLSLLFTLIVMVAFYLTLKIILQQKKVSEVKNDFINNMTHELKTPIATISLATDAMARSINESARGFTNIIKQESERMNKHVEQILQMARIDRNEFKIQPETIDINEFTRDVCDNQQIRVEELGGNFQFIPHSEPVLVQADPDHFANVLYNLIDNAIKYADKKPIITIKIKTKESFVFIHVKDDGIGMSKETMKHVFDKFYRATSGNIHNVKGFGLGLSYVKAVVTQHKGDILVKSELGKGSEFIVKLPLVTDN